MVTQPFGFGVLLRRLSFGPGGVRFEKGGARPPGSGWPPIPHHVEGGLRRELVSA